MQRLSVSPFGRSSSDGKVADWLPGLAPELAKGDRQPRRDAGGRTALQISAPPSRQLRRRAELRREQSDEQEEETEVFHGKVLVGGLKLKPGMARVNPKPTPINQRQSLVQSSTASPSIH